jgi:hypothetical protein
MKNSMKNKNAADRWLYSKAAHAQRMLAKAREKRDSKKVWFYVEVYRELVNMMDIAYTCSPNMEKTW